MVKAAPFRPSQLVTPVAVVTIAVIYLLSQQISAGWTLGSLYIFPMIFVALWSSSRRSFEVILTATLCTVVLSLGFFVFPISADRWYAKLFYVLPVATIWMIAGLSVLRKAAQTRTAIMARAALICPSCRQVREEDGAWDLQSFFKLDAKRILEMRVCRQCATTALDPPGTFLSAHPQSKTLPSWRSKKPSGR